MPSPRGYAAVSTNTADANRRLRRRLVFRSSDSRLGRLESDLRVRAVTERLLRGGSAPAQRERPLRNYVRLAIPVQQAHIFAVDEIGTVLPERNRRCHRRYPIFCIAERNSVLPLVL